MRIAHIVCSYPPYFGGMGNVVFQMAQELSHQGHDVEVFTPAYYENKEIRDKEAAPARTHTPALQEQIDYANRLTPSLQYGNAARLPQIKHELDDFDIVHLHYPFFGTANLVRKWKLRNPHKPLVVTYHMDTRASNWKGLIFKLYSKYWMPKILGAADALIASSFDYIESSDARKLFVANKKKWHEIPFGVDIERFIPFEKSFELMAQHGLLRDVPTVLFVGGMDQAHYFKGIPVLLQAFTILKQQGEKFQAILVGDGELRSNYERQTKALGISDQVHFVGRVEDDVLPLYYNLADLLVLPSIHQGEAFGMVLLEAMASGVPVLVTDLPGVRTVARYAGQTVPVKNPMALSESIHEFFSDPENSAHWGIKARTAAETIFSWPSIIEKTTELYKNLIKK